MHLMVRFHEKGLRKKDVTDKRLVLKRFRANVLFYLLILKSQKVNNNLHIGGLKK